MLSLELAQALKRAGLIWRPQRYDHFVIPDMGLDEQEFVITDMVVTPEVLDGSPAISFNGAVEWALDYIMQADAIWLPTEAQLRAALQTHCDSAAGLSLTWRENAYCCAFTCAGQSRTCQAAAAETAYALALLACLPAADLFPRWPEV